ncbi:MAG: hypothetical protein GF334_04780 [Candidatus Altiarchaeales archaeon]|nr:hypothetical protein [Candidatus Altiarchaeales archaeon]
MGEETYVDVELLAELGEDDYLVRVSKEDLNSLVSFSRKLVVRHWDGDKPVLLSAYGDDAVRTKADASEGNNLTNLPRVNEDFLKKVR